MEKGVTEVEVKVRGEIKQIYQTMMKFGYPALLSYPVFDTQIQIQKYLSEFFQPTPKRENLIQWLILTINPLYSQEIQTKINKKRIILNNLWKLGVMPFSKHTNNLDYQKYVDGLLGYQNSVNLIYNLCVLLKTSFQFDKAKEDPTFASFMDEIIYNYDALVNIDYDPYKISFPAAFQELSSEQFEQQYEEILKPIIKKRQQGKIEYLKVENNQEQIFNSFEQNKTKFQELYSTLIGKVKEVITNHSEMIQNWKKPDEFKGRTLNISQNLAKKYRQYKEKIKISKMTHSNLTEEKQNLKFLIQSLNDTVCL